LVGLSIASPARLLIGIWTLAQSEANGPITATTLAVRA
jgi:hypothetical protein